MRRLVLVAVTGCALAACSAGRRVKTAPPVAAAAPTAVATPTIAKSAGHEAAAPVSELEEARRADYEGRDLDALALFERVASTTGDSRVRLAAQLGAARIRLSADPASRDLRKAQVLLEGAERSAADVDVPIPVGDLLQLLRDVADLRTQLRAARAETKSLEAEMAKKDEALRRVTSAVVGARSPER
jgi:hypothetical protein